LLSLYHHQIIWPIGTSWFHWTVLPQGMANSPTMCQEFVTAAIEPTRHKYPEAMSFNTWTVFW
jgi:hypothetical protein